MTVARTALLITPATDPAFATDMAALLPLYPRHLVAHVPNDGQSPHPDAALAATEPFHRDRPDLVIHGCTAAALLAGPEATTALIAHLAERFAAPVIGTIDAIIQALHHTDARQIALLTPYPPDVNDALRAALDAAGIEVDVLSSLGADVPDRDVPNRGVPDRGVLERDVLERAIAMAGTMHDALLIASSRLPALNLIGPLRARLGIPVWSSASATAWLAARQVAAVRQGAPAQPPA